MSRRPADLPAPPEFRLMRRFRDIDEFAATARAWDLDFRQLTTGELDARLEQSQMSGVQIGHVTFNRAIQQYGAAPVGARTFGILPDARCLIDWCGRPVGCTQLMSFRPEGEFDSVSLENFTVITITVADELLAAAATYLGVDESRLRSSGPRADVIDSARMANLHRSLASLRKGLAGSTHRLALDTVLTEELPAALIAAVTGEPVRPRPRSGRRFRAFVAARNQVLDSRGDALTVRQLALSSGVSERTLEYAFRDLAGMSPKVFIRATRLNQVRRQLQIADTDNSISDVANRWGFWHMGQFAADYRAQFGELPSTTLRRRRERAWRCGS